MRSRVLLASLLLVPMLGGCFPRLAHYEDSPAPPADGVEFAFEPERGSVPVERVVAFALTINPGLRPDEARRQASAMVARAAQHKVPTHLLVSLIATESAFNPLARSPVGAQGLGQLMPATAREMGVRDPFDVEENIDGTARYLAWLAGFWRQHPQRWELVLASYLAGVGTVSRQQKAGQPFTREQVSYINRIFRLSGRV
ncbi:MAG: lytic transglycosylase domain-containing protein [Candidatus Sericytochromatia bacterium]|nr:lytic transglycosylase domain-containing protein [Candidatus Sericytochromatia bacterium]